MSECNICGEAARDDYPWCCEGAAACLLRAERARAEKAERELAEARARMDEGWEKYHRLSSKAGVSRAQMAEDMRRLEDYGDGMVVKYDALRSRVLALAEEWERDSHGFRQGGYDDCARALREAVEGKP